MNGAGLAQRLALPLLFAVACNGEFHFDRGPEPPRAAAGTGASPSSGASGASATAGSGASGTPSNTSGASGASENEPDNCAHCSEYGLVCEPEQRVCVECNEDGDCPTGNPYCDTTQHRCTPCTIENGCPAGSVCDGWSHSCLRSCAVEVDPDQDCGHSTRLCDNRSLCVECMDDDECPYGQHCAGGARCADCAHDSDCSGTAHFCDQVTFTCVACRDFRDCGTTFVCDPKTHACLANDD